MVTTKDIQRALHKLGFLDADDVDGRMGKATREALRAFQKKAGLKVDGIAGPVTLGALGATSELKAKSPPVKRKGRTIRTLVWHCTATPEGREFTVKQITAMHRARGFATIGYHKVIHLDGKVSEGRPEAMAGAHVSGHNSYTIGYSYVGGVTAKNKPKDTRTEAQKAAMIELTKAAIAKYKLRAVVGHRDLSTDLDGDGVVEPHEWVKICPCFNAVAEYGHLLK